MGLPHGVFSAMHFFLDPDFDQGKGILNPEESVHASKVLRLRQGDLLQIGTGRGIIYTCELIEVKRDQATVKVLEEEIFPEPITKVSVGIAPTKNLSRFEWFLEKATELGVWEVIPILTERTLRDRIKPDRAEKIVLQASKQSRRLFIPKVHPLTPFDQILEMKQDVNLIAHCYEDRDRSALSLSDGSGSSLILIGPEGDFTVNEVEKAENSGFESIILGENRLRTETAGILAVALLQLSEA